MMEALIENIKSVFARIDRETAAFAEASGMRCRAECGECCHTAVPEARVLELLPTAARIVAEGREDEVLAAAAAAGGTCVFYRPNATDPTLGRCGNYETRPGICRLFGYAAVRDKHGMAGYAACHWQKRLQPEAIEKVKREIGSGTLSIPAFYAFDQEFWGLEPSQSLGEKLPINQALVRAIERHAWVSRRGADRPADA